MSTLTAYINTLTARIEHKQKEFFAEEDGRKKLALKAEMDLMREMQVELKLVNFQQNGEKT